MDNINYTQNVCNLCYQPNENCLNIYDDYKINKLSILTKHFWFLIIDDNDNKNFQKICTECWQKTIDFDSFFNYIKFAQQNYHQYQNLTTTTTEQTIKYEVEVELNSDNYDYDEIANFVDNIEQNEDKISDAFVNNEDPLIKTKKVIRRKNAKKSRKKSNTEKLDQINTGKAEAAVKSKLKTEYLDEQIKSFYEMNCEICGDGLETFSNLKQHYQDVHKQPAFISCCGKKYFHRVKIFDHLMQHLNPDGIYNCEICQKKFSSKTRLNNHKELMHLSNDEPFTCDICENTKAYTTKRQLTRHIKTRHCPQYKKSHECSECKKKYLYKYMLDTHFKNVHDTSSGFICDICAVMLKSKYSVEQHKIDVHGIDAPPKVQCDKCGAWLKNSSNMRKHKNFNCLLSNKSGSYKCPFCDKLCPTRGSLICHKNNVHSESKFQCTLCEKSFKKSTSLKEHLAYHTGQALYTCQYCPQTFKSNANYHSHRKKVHSEEWHDEHTKRQIGLVSKFSKIR